MVPFDARVNVYVAAAVTTKDAVAYSAMAFSQNLKVRSEIRSRSALRSL